MSDRRRLLMSAANALDSDYIENIKVLGDSELRKYFLYITSIVDTVATSATITLKKFDGSVTRTFYTNIPELSAGVDKFVILGNYSPSSNIMHLKAFDIDDDFIIEVK